MYCVGGDNVVDHDYTVRVGVADVQVRVVQQIDDPTSDRLEDQLLLGHPLRTFMQPHHDFRRSLHRSNPQLDRLPPRFQGDIVSRVVADEARVHHQPIDTVE